MLYISRLVHGFTVLKYGVVDTEDGKEEVVSNSDLYCYCQEYDLTIRGCIPDEPKVGFSMNGVFPFQHPDYMTKAQAKLFMLYGIELTLWKDMITRIAWEPSEIKEPIELRLSDYGGRLGDYIFAGLACSATHKVTVVLDDNINFNDQSLHTYSPFFLCLDSYGLKYDIRDMQDKEKVRAIYRMVDEVPGRSGSFPDELIDSPERKDYMWRLLHAVHQ